MLNRAEYEGRIRADVLDSLIRYAETGCPTGGFLAAVLSNDLIDAVARADAHNRRTLCDIAGFVYTEMPRACYGSREAVRQWIAAGARMEQQA